MPRFKKPILIALMAAVLSSPFLTQNANAHSDVKVGATVTLPLANGMISVAVGDILYGFYQGVFYRPVAHGRYQPVAAPIGAVIPHLPKGYQRHKNSYQYGHVYYQQVPNGYRVIDNPNKTVIRKPAKQSNNQQGTPSHAPQKYSGSYQQSHNSQRMNRENTQPTQGDSQKGHRLFPGEERY